MKIRESYLHAKNAKEIVRAIAQRLLQINRGMSDSLSKFVEFNEDPIDLTKDQVWEMSTNPLINLDDQDLMRIPKSCLANAATDFKLYQAVVRYKLGWGKTSIVHFAADSTVLNELESNAPLQLSYLYIHEWLRSYTENAHVLSMANQILHAEKWPTIEGDFVRALEQIGLTGVDLEGTYTGHYVFAFALTRNDSDTANAVFSNLDIVQNDDKTVTVHGKLRPLPLSLEGFFLDKYQKTAKFLPTRKSISLPEEEFTLDHVALSPSSATDYQAPVTTLQIPFRKVGDKSEKVYMGLTPLDLRIGYHMDDEAIHSPGKATACLRVRLVNSDSSNGNGYDKPIIHNEYQFTGYYCRTK